MKTTPPSLFFEFVNERGENMNSGHYYHYLFKKGEGKT